MVKVNLHNVLIRCSDLLLATVALVLLSPMLFVTAIIIRLDSSGPAIFQQKRVGQNGALFIIYKFRTMQQWADQIPPQFRQNKDGKIEPVIKVRNDPRVTKVGHYLRRFSIDELPQFMNVLRGNMSLVGPRPSVPSEVNLYTAYQQRRLAGKPGLTGIAQISGRTDLDFDNIVALDLAYLNKRTIWSYYRILLLTVPFVLTAKGAY